MTNLPLAVAASTFPGELRSIPRAARAIGVGGLQFDAFSPALDFTELSGSGRREFLRVLATADQRLAGLHVDLGPRGVMPGADVDRLLSQLNKVMAAAVGLAAPLVCVEMGPLPAPRVIAKPRPAVTPAMAGLLILPAAAELAVPIDPPPPPHDAAGEAHVDAALTALGEHADRIGVSLAFGSDLASFAAIERALRAAGCPWFGVDLDPVALLRDAWDADEIFSRLGPTIRHVRGRDAIVGADRRTRPMPIGRGDTKWNQLLANLDGAAYRGAITIDPLELHDRVAGAAEGVKYLKRHACA